MHASQNSRLSLANSLLGVRIWADGLEQLIDTSLAAIQGREPAHRPYVFACANPHSLTVADRDPVFKLALREADAVVADGVGMQIAANLCGRSLGPRITGIDYFRALMAALDRRGGARVAYFGSARACSTSWWRAAARHSRTFRSPGPSRRHMGTGRRRPISDSSTKSMNRDPMCCGWA